MNRNKNLSTEHQSVCENKWYHAQGRPPFADFALNGVWFCKICLLSRITEESSFFNKASRPPIAPPLTKWECASPHPRPVKAELSADGVSLCWPCLESLMIDGKGRQLASL